MHARHTGVPGHLAYMLGLAKRVVSSLYAHTKWHGAAGPPSLASRIQKHSHGKDLISSRNMHHFFPKTSYVHIYVIRLHTTLIQAFSSHTARASYRKKTHNIYGVRVILTHNMSYDIIHITFDIIRHHVVSFSIIHISYCIMSAHSYVGSRPCDIYACE